MAEVTDPHTLRYVQQLPLILAPLPSFAASSSHTLFSHQPPPQTAALWTKCSACRVEMVGGINATYWTDRGALWATCGACGFSTRRDGAGEAVDSARAGETGKGQFVRVKKRRRVEEKRTTESVHPTALKNALARAEQPLSKSLPAQAKEKKRNLPAASTLPSPASSAKPTPPPSALPSRPPSADSSRPASLPTSSSASPAPSLPPPAAAKPKPPSATASTAPLFSAPSSRPPSAPSSSKPSPSASPAARTLQDREKEKKRKKKPSGLAEMLEAKKKREKEAQAGGAGLMDFLQGL